MSWRWVISRIGAVLLVLGVLLLLFVAYELWGTSITTRLHQETLRQQFDRELARAKHARSASEATSSTTTSTLPTQGVVPPTPGLAPADGQPIGTIDIPAIGANYVVVQGTSPSDLELGPGHYAGTPLPGQPGNAAIAGHRTTYLHPFYNLNELGPGDPIYVTTAQGRFTYEVTDSMVVAPTDVAVLDPTPVPTLTLTTCNPRYSAAQRLVVQASLVTPPVSVATSRTPTSSSATARPHTRASGHGLGGENGSALSSIAWGAAVAAVGVALTFVLRRQRSWPSKVVVGATGLVATLVLLFFFFQAVTPLLPASF